MMILREGRLQIMKNRQSAYECANKTVDSGWHDECDYLSAVIYMLFQEKKNKQGQLPNKNITTETEILIDMNSFILLIVSQVKFVTILTVSSLNSPPKQRIQKMCKVQYS